ncbi:MAG: MalY/PatB family protein, partial [Pseudomonadales bacterium]
DAAGFTNKSMIKIPAVHQADRWLIDFEVLETAAAKPEAQLLLFCNPQNPTGRVASKEELAKLADICLRHDVIICSDEIHADFVFDGKTHLPIASLSDEVSRQTITLSAPSKSFGLSGIGGGYAIIENKAMRKKFIAASEGLFANLSDLAIVAMESAYADCDDWLAALLAYLHDNRAMAHSHLSALPGLTTDMPEATYFQWLDFRGSGLNDPHATLVEAGIALSDGARFGLPGFLRLNFATPKARLAEALARIEGKLSG